MDSGRIISDEFFDDLITYLKENEPPLTRPIRKPSKNVSEPDAAWMGDERYRAKWRGDVKYAELLARDQLQLCRNQYVELYNVVQFLYVGKFEDLRDLLTCNNNHGLNPFILALYSHWWK